MKHFSILIIVLLSIIGCQEKLWAKKEAILVLDPIKGLSTNICFNSVTVLDLRTDKSSIGKTPDIFKWINVVTKDSLSSELKEFVRKMSNWEATKRDEKLLILVRNLKYKDRVSRYTPISTIYLNVDCYLGNEQGYQLVLNIDSLYEYAAVKMGEGFQVFSDNLDYLLTMMVNNVAQSKASLSHLQPLAQILSTNSEAKKNLLIYTTQAKRGGYNPFKQFCDNSPTDTSFIYDCNCSGGILANCAERFYLPSENGSEKKGTNIAEIGCFAIYNNENKKWYRPISTSKFMPMSFENGDFYFYETQKGLFVEDYSGMRVGVAGTITSSILEGQQRRKPPEFKDAIYKIRLDPLTGRGIRMERVDVTKKIQ